MQHTVLQAIPPPGRHTHKKACMLGSSSRMEILQKNNACLSPASHTISHQPPPPLGSPKHTVMEYQHKNRRKWLPQKSICSEWVIFSQGRSLEGSRKLAGVCISPNAATGTPDHRSPPSLSVFWQCVMKSQASRSGLSLQKEVCGLCRHGCRSL